MWNFWSRIAVTKVIAVSMSCDSSVIITVTITYLTVAKLHVEITVLHRPVRFVLGECTISLKPAHDCVYFVCNVTRNLRNLVELP